MKTLGIVAILFVCCVLCGCGAAVHVDTNGPDAPGFWWGIWHGLISPITFLLKVFGFGIDVYAKTNCGAWYDFGFLLGCGAFAGGSSSAASKSR